MSVDKVEQLFNKAVEMTSEASNKLPETMHASSLLGVVFTALLDAERAQEGNTK